MFFHLISVSSGILRTPVLFQQFLTLKSYYNASRKGALKYFDKDTWKETQTGFFLSILPHFLEQLLCFM